MNKEIEKFINDVQKEFPEYEVNIDNVNDFYMMLEEKKNNYKDGIKTIYRDGQFLQIKLKTFDILTLSPYQNIINNSLPETVLKADFKDFDLNSESRKKIYDYMQKFIKNYKNMEKGLYIYGGFSIGKTYSMGCLYKELIRNDIDALMVYLPDLVISLKNSIQTDKYVDIIDVLKTCDVLLIDELGAENLTEWFRDEVLCPVLNYRLVEKKPIFVTSNIEPRLLPNHFRLKSTEDDGLKCDRIVSRIQSLVTFVSFEDSNKYKR